MKWTNLTLIPPLVLVAAIVTTPVMVSEDVFARYQRRTGGDLSQAASVTNSCLNPVSNSNTNDNMINNGNCGGTISRQGGSGQSSSPTTVQNANPAIEVQRSTMTPTTQPPTTPHPDSSATLVVNFVCAAPRGSTCDSSAGQTNITITGNNPQPHTFLISNGNSQSVTLGAGKYTVTDHTLLNPNDVGFAFDCKSSVRSPLAANGTIAAGQTQRCGIVHIEI